MMLSLVKCVASLIILASCSNHERPYKVNQTCVNEHAILNAKREVENNSVKLYDL